LTSTLCARELEVQIRELRISKYNHTTVTHILTTQTHLSDVLIAMVHTYIEYVCLEWDLDALTTSKSYINSSDIAISPDKHTAQIGTEGCMFDVITVISKHKLSHGRGRHIWHVRVVNHLDDMWIGVTDNPLPTYMGEDYGEPEQERAWMYCCGTSKQRKRLWKGHDRDDKESDHLVFVNGDKMRKYTSDSVVSVLLDLDYHYVAFFLDGNVQFVCFNLNKSESKINTKHNASAFRNSHRTEKRDSKANPNGKAWFLAVTLSNRGDCVRLIQSSERYIVNW